MKNWISNDPLNKNNLIQPDRTRIFGSDNWFISPVEFTATLTNNYAVSPDGSKTANRFTATSGTGHGLAFAPRSPNGSISFAMIGNERYMMSSWIKDNGSTGTIDLNYHADFETQTTATYNWGSNVTGQLVSGSWSLISSTFLTRPDTVSGAINYMSNWEPLYSSDLLFWGAKLEPLQNIIQPPARVPSSQSWMGTDSVQYAVTWSVGYETGPDNLTPATRIQIPVTVGTQVGITPKYSAVDWPYIQYPVDPSSWYQISVWAKFLAPCASGNFSMQMQMYDATGSYIDGALAYPWSNVPTNAWTLVTTVLSSTAQTANAYFSFYSSWSPETASDFLLWGPRIDKINPYSSPYGPYVSNVQGIVKTRQQPRP